MADIGGFYPIKAHQIAAQTMRDFSDGLLDKIMGMKDLARAISETSERLANGIGRGRAVRAVGRCELHPTKGWRGPGSVSRGTNRRRASCL